MIDTLKIYGEVSEEVELKRFNTYRINSKVKYLVSPYDIESLKNLVLYLNKNKIKYFVLGNGSNIVLCNEYYDGVFIKLDKFNKIELNGNSVFVEAGVMFPKLVNYVVNNNLKGLEWAQGIPGTIGGSIVGNAGAYKSEISEFLENVTVLDKDGNVKTINKEDLVFKYRYSSFKDKLKDVILISALLKLENGNKEESLKIMEDRLNRRVSSQPLEYPSAGSVFRNPEGDAAGRIIEQEIGFKGKRIGGALVSEKHANFIINNGNATGCDVKELIGLIHKEVKEKVGVDLIIEQEFIEWE